MTPNISKPLYWTPRVLAILFLGFLAVFSLDVFEAGSSAGRIILGLFMHNIPVFALAAILWVSWKREIIAGVVFTAVGSLFLLRSIIILVMNGFGQVADALLGSLPLAVPALLVGILFIINWRKRRAADRALPPNPPPAAEA